MKLNYPTCRFLLVSDLFEIQTAAAKSGKPTEHGLGREEAAMQNIGHEEEEEEEEEGQRGIAVRQTSLGILELTTIFGG